MGTSETGSLAFIDNVTADRSNSMNCEGYKAILAAHVQPYAAKLMTQSNPRVSKGKEMSSVVKQSPDFCNS